MSQKKVIMIVGGGSGGHLTPIIAIANSLKKLSPEIEVVHVGQKNEGLQNITEDKSIDMTFAITAGKFRRYHGESFVSHLLDIKTLLLNVRDLFRFLYGTLEAWFLLGRVKPNSIMLKGGFVSVPVGIAARLRRIPYLTHDSDAVPGLANRLTSKRAVYNTTALPPEVYPYDTSKTVQVGIPIRKEFVQVTEELKQKAKEHLDIDKNVPVLLSVGGGLGAQRMNRALVESSNNLLEQNEELVIIHFTGKKLLQETTDMYRNNLTEKFRDRVKVIDFTTELYKYSAAADIILTRGGATNIAEFAAQAKPCIVVPNPVLTGGQQLHNAKVLSDSGAAIILQESDLDKLASVVIELFNKSAAEKKSLGDKLHKLAVYDSSDRLATMLIEMAK
jgi:UDP-N-acetylglucosamine--N-acetylmuramyl-(pentapeptide) pyrophosphoryl-undecaprenol N-acetylglucosamine transferase